MNEISVTKALSARSESHPTTSKENTNAFKDELDRACNSSSEDMPSRPKTGPTKEKDTERPLDQDVDNGGDAVVVEDTSVKDDKPKNINLSPKANLIIESKVLETGTAISSEINSEVSKIQPQTVAIQPQIVATQPQATPLVQSKEGVLDVTKPQVKTVNIESDLKAEALKTSELKDGKATAIILNNLQNETTKQESSAPRSPEINPLQIAKTSVEGVDSELKLIKTETSINERTHILNKKWSQNIAAKIAVNSANGMQQIKARINPVSMGPIEIQISKTDDTMNISMVVTSSATKELLDSNQSKILQSMRDAGMDVSGFDINQHNQQGNQSEDTNRNENSDFSNYPEGDLREDEVELSESINLIDSYA